MASFMLHVGHSTKRLFFKFGDFVPTNFDNIKTHQDL